MIWLLWYVIVGIVVSILWTRSNYNMQSDWYEKELWEIIVLAVVMIIIWPVFALSMFRIIKKSLEKTKWS